MKKYEVLPRQTVVDIVCDACGASCRTPLGDYECATLSATWGYHSRKDGQTDIIDLCENCFDDAIKYLKNRPQRSV